MSEPSRARAPLAGRRVIITRPRAQAGELADRLHALGASVEIHATIAIVPPEDVAPLDDAIRALARYDWIAFTSANAVTALAERRDALGVRGAPLPRLAAIGPGTAAVLAARLGAPDCVASVHTGEALAAALPEVAGARVLVPRADIAGDALVEGLRARGATVEAVVAYRTVPGDGIDSLGARLCDGGIDAVLFASPSSVRYLLTALRATNPAAAAALVAPTRPALFCVGPSTAHAARELALAVDAIADEHTSDGLVDVLVHWFGAVR